jgi:monovalent cation:proton antiporter-2 (CPA2) family protein
MHLLELAAAFLLATVLLVPLFQYFKLGSVLGYLAAGMLLGPWGLGFMTDSENTRGAAELGVALLLFLVGLELDPARLWRMRKAVFGYGSAQVALSAVALGLLAAWLGVSWQAAVVTGAGLAMSSTAIVLASLAERGQLNSGAGQKVFAVLLFQDMAVIPLIALMPLLAYASLKDAVDWTDAAKAVAAIAAFIVAGRLLVRPALKFIASRSNTEVFTAAALLLVIGAAVIMENIGVSISLGAFLAGLMLADSEFRHELEADIEPFKGLLLGLFFVTVGMGTNLTLFREMPVYLLGLGLGVMSVKFAVIWAVAAFARMPIDEGQRFAIALAQGGEFAFVLFGTAAGTGVLRPELRDLLVMVVTVSMVLAVPAMLLHERLLASFTARKVARDYDRIDAAPARVIIAGFGRFGQIVARVLRMCRIPFTALEASYAQVDFVRRYGNRIYYGDASRPELLHAAKAGEARLFVLAIDDVEASIKTAMVVRRHFPNLEIIARARNRVHYFRLRDLGIRNIHRETLPASLAAAHAALLELDYGTEASDHAIRFFRQQDEAQLEAEYAVHHDEAQLIQTTQQVAAQLRDLFEADMAQPPPASIAPVEAPPNSRQEVDR